MRVDATVKCDLLGDFACRNEAPVEPTPGIKYGGFTSAPTVFLGEYVVTDIGAPREKPFKILLKDQRVVTVRGHSVTFLPNAGNPTDAGSYGVLARSQGRDVLVALFRASEVTGVFDGSLQTA